MEGWGEGETGRVRVVAKGEVNRDGPVYAFSPSPHLSVSPSSVPPW
jgi:hypothetical protein